MDFIFDVLFGGVFGLFALLLPECAENRGKKIVLSGLGATVFYSSIVLMIAGVVLLLYYPNHAALGTGLTAAGAALLFVRLVAGFILFGYRLKKSVREGKDNNASAEADIAASDKH